MKGSSHDRLRLFAPGATVFDRTSAGQFDTLIGWAFPPNSELPMPRATLLRRVGPPATALALGLLAGPALLDAVTLPHTFVNDTTANATEVNANFTALKAAVDALQGKPPAGSIVQTVIATSTTPASLDVTNFTEADASYRIAITPKYADSRFLVEFYFPAHQPMAVNTVHHIQLVRDPAGTPTPIGTGPVSGTRQRVTWVSRPNNGYDSNDQTSIYLLGTDSGLAAGTPTTYGFRYRRETGGSGAINFLRHTADNAVYAFSGVMTMKVTEVAQ